MRAQERVAARSKRKRSQLKQCLLAVDNVDEQQQQHCLRLQVRANRNSLKCAGFYHSCGANANKHQLTDNEPTRLSDLCDIAAGDRHDGQRRVIVMGSKRNQGDTRAVVSPHDLNTITDPCSMLRNRAMPRHQQSRNSQTKPSYLLLFLLTLSINQANTFQVAQAALVTSHQDNANSQQAKSVPYNTVLVTQVCEWKSNLFVPKSNDIRFAQAFYSPSQRRMSSQDAPDYWTNEELRNHQRSLESSIVYESSPSLVQQTTNNAANYKSTASESQTSSQQELVNSKQQTTSKYQDLPPATTTSLVESNADKALVLALPIDFGHQFAGFEPACSIRLIVPPNMRILAQVTSRRLKFEYEQPAAAATAASSHQSAPADAPPFFGLPPSPAFLWPQQPPTSSSHLAQPQHETTLWLNVSQDPFVEFDQRTIETEANELAFRFLLERNAHKRFPDTRFQVVLTAFQTLSENSDLNHAPQNQPTGQQVPPAQGEQFICDQQRLISANLACDGYKNCQDGHDEEPHACALRHPNLANGNSPTQDGGATTISQQQQPHLNQQQTNTSKEDSSSSSWPHWPAWFASRSKASQGQSTDSSSSNDATSSQRWASVSGFLLGALLALLLLLACMLPLCYCVYILLTDRARWRQFFATGGPASVLSRERRRRRHQDTLSSQEEAGARASVFRLPFVAKAFATGSSSRRQQQQSSSKQQRVDGFSSSGAGGRRDRAASHRMLADNKLEQARLQASDLRRQNADNERRLSALIEPSSSSHIPAGEQKQQQQQQQQQPPRLQSILKRPASVQPASGQLHQQRPFEPPPDIPERPIRRGALASSLRSRGASGNRQAAMAFPRQVVAGQQQPRPPMMHQPSAGAVDPSSGRQSVPVGAIQSPSPQAIANQQQQAMFKPTPAQRLTRPTRPVPAPAMSPSQRLDLRQRQEQQQRVTTYHFSSASTSFSQAYLEQLPLHQQQQQQQSQQSSQRQDMAQLQRDNPKAPPDKQPSPNHPNSLI